MSHWGILPIFEFCLAAQKACFSLGLASFFRDEGMDRFARPVPSFGESVGDGRGNDIDLQQ